jgi:hypothetical protein
MGETICGHEREALIFACKYHATHERQGLEFPLDAVREMSGEVPSPGNTYGPASVAVAGPAKLAAIISGIMRACGVDALSYGALASEFDMSDVNDPIAVSAWAIVANQGPNIIVASATKRRQLSMPQARAFALKLLDAPVDTDIERMIEEVSNVHA